MINDHKTYYIPESVCKEIRDSLNKLEQECESSPKWTPFQAFYNAVFIISFSLALACVFNGVSPVELIQGWIDGR